LDEEHQKLTQTINQATELVKSDTVPKGIGVKSSRSSNKPIADRDSGKNSSGREVGNDADMLFVQEVDYQDIFGQCIVALAVAALDGKFVACNTTFESVSGYSREELEKKSLFNLLSHKDVEDVFQVMGELLKDDNSVNSENTDAISLVEKKKKTYWSGTISQKDQTKNILINITLARTSDGMPKYFQCALATQ